MLVGLVSYRSSSRRQLYPVITRKPEGFIKGDQALKRVHNEAIFKSEEFFVYRSYGSESGAFEAAGTTSVTRATAAASARSGKSDESQADG